MPTYTPKPIETAHINLSQNQHRLIELLSANAHDVWAQKRQADGWTYGPSRNDALKTHPSLVPFDDLPESEKDYDRVMVEQVIRGAIAIGYKIDI